MKRRIDHPLSTALALLCALLLAQMACASRKLASVPLQPTVVERAPQGWTLVRQPGWFSISMPHAPDHGELQTTAPQGGVLVMKQLSATTQGAFLAIAYSELVGFDDHDAMLAEVRKSLQSGGATPVKQVDIEVSGRQGVEGTFDIPPETTLNASKLHATARVRVLLDNNRAYVLIGVEPVNSANSVLAKFFDSFAFAPPAQTTSP